MVARRCFLSRFNSFPPFAILALAWLCLSGQTALANGAVNGLTKTRDVVDARTYPFSAVGRVQWAGIRDRAHCTGALIGERVVLTAAHCLFSMRTKKWISPRLIHFVAGYHKGDPLAHSRVESYQVPEQFDLTKGLIQSNLENDWALLTLRKPIGRKVGSVGWEVLDQAGLKRHLGGGWRILLAGYPKDRSHVISIDEECRAALRGKLIEHDCFTTNGDSGGPLMLVKGKRMKVVGLNSSNIEYGRISRAIPLKTLQRELSRTLGLKQKLSQAERDRLARGMRPRE